MTHPILAYIAQRMAHDLATRYDDTIQTIEIRVSADALPLIDLGYLFSVRTLNGVPVTYPEEPSPLPLPRHLEVIARGHHHTHAWRYITAEAFNDAYRRTVA